MNSSAADCDSLIASAHFVDINQQYIFSPTNRIQITHTAFLNLFIAWEAFLETMIISMMTGNPTTSGGAPNRFVMPLDEEAADLMIKHTATKFFDYSSHDNVKKVVTNYFQNGYPFEPFLGSIFSDLSDMKTMRNACAHIGAATQRPLEALANRIFGQPQIGTSVYILITSPDPRNPPNTVYVTYRDKLLAAAAAISHG